MLPTTIRSRAAADEGFSLIEILVVILIIGILAAIAIPSFVTQKDKASDAGAKSYARHLQTAQEAYFIDNSTYATTLARLQTLEPALRATPSRTAPTASGTATTFSVAATSNSGVTYTIARARDGRITRSCDRASVAGCNARTSW